MKLQSDEFEDGEELSEETLLLVEAAEAGGGNGDGIDAADLPASLIVTKLHVNVFNEQEERLRFENLFREFEETATFQYFKSFRRAKVNFSSSAVAAQARIQLHQTQLGINLINCYFAQPLVLRNSANDPYLQLPAPVKQFLISPPASPPVGWEPVSEAQPVINYDLLSAIATLAPGEAHELHPPSDNQPGIVVHVCHAEENISTQGLSLKPKIIHTSCPPHASQN